MRADEDFYEQAGREVASRQMVPGVAAKAFSDALGNKERTVALYIKYRVEQLRHEEDQRQRQEQLKRRMTNRQGKATPRSLICPNCGSQTPIQKLTERNPEKTITILLIFLGIVPGFIYFATIHDKVVCRQCGNIFRMKDEDNVQPEVAPYR